MNTKKRWICSALVALAVVVFFSLYSYFRQGVFNIDVINKILASTAAVVAGISLLIGPLSWRFELIKKFVVIRRQLGLLALSFAIFHVVATLIQIDKFKIPTWYLSHWVPVAFGLIASAVWCYMFFISSDKKVKEMGLSIWKKRLSLMGNFSFLAVLVHLVVIKNQSWTRWLQKLFPSSGEFSFSFPPSSLFVLVLMLGILLYRLKGDLTKPKS